MLVNAEVATAAAWVAICPRRRLGQRRIRCRSVPPHKRFVRRFQTQSTTFSFTVASHSPGSTMRTYTYGVPVLWRR